MSDSPQSMQLDSPDAQSMMKQFGASKSKGGSGASGGTGSASDANSALQSNPLNPFNQTQKQGQQKAPRQIGTPLQEAGYIAKDAAQSMLQLLPGFMQDILHINQSDTPQEKARKQKMLQNYQKLNAEEQQFVQKKFQEEQMKKRREQEEEMMKKKREEEQKQASVAPPKGKVQGYMGGAAGKSNKKSTIDDMNMKRQQLSSAG